MSRVRTKGMSRARLDLTATRRLIKIGRLEQELAAERNIVKALEAMDFSPDQDVRVLSRVKKAYTMRRQLRENSDGENNNKKRVDNQPA